MMKLNLGCGEKKRDGYVNVDVCGTPDVVCDLNRFPWDWTDNSIDEVTSSHWLEHVEDFERTILEIHRILKPNGVLHFHVPHFRTPFAIWHLHKWQFSTCTCDLLCAKLPYLWGGRQLFVRDKIAVRCLFVRKRFAWPLTKLANYAPCAWDWLGLPIDEIEFFGRKVADG